MICVSGAGAGGGGGRGEGEKESSSGRCYERERERESLFREIPINNDVLEICLVGWLDTSFKMQTIREIPRYSDSGVCVCACTNTFHVYHMINTQFFLFNGCPTVVQWWWPQFVFFYPIFFFFIFFNCCPTAEQWWWSQATPVKTSKWSK
jgi:hypothetical protein